MLSSSGAPVPNAYVNMWNQRDSYSGRSSDDGTYRIQGVAPGTYELGTWSPNGEVYWPYDGEYWEDELGTYVYTTESSCVN